VRRRAFVRGAYFMLNRPGSCGGIFGCSNRSSDHNVRSASLNGFGGSHHAGLIPMIGAGGPNSGIDDQEILVQFCA
jgi:hypothetical protein